MTRRRRWPIALVVTLILFEGLYLAAANYVLNSDRIFELINRKPEKFWIHWDSAWTLWPGMARIRGVETRGQSKSIQWFAAVDEIETSYRVIPLFWRTVDLTYVGAEGLEYRQRRRLDRMPEATGPVPGMPEIPGLVNPPDPPPEKLYPKKPPKPPWRVIARRVDARDFRQIWIDRYRFVGDSDVDVSMDLTVRGPLAFPEIRFRTEGAEVRVEEEAVFSDMTVDVGIVLEPFIPRETKGVAFFDYLSGTFSIEMHASHLQFMKPYFSKVDWVKMNGNGRFSVNIALDKGAIVPGARLDIDTEHVDMTFLDRHLTGTGRIDGEVVLEGDTPVSKLTVRLDRFQVAEEGDPEPYIVGEGFLFEMIGRGADLTNPFDDVSIVLDLPESEILDVGFYNNYVPAASDLELVSGTGSISYHFEASHEKHSLNGRMEVTMKHLGTRFGDLGIAGDLKITTLLREGRPLERAFDISGTKIEMTNARVVMKKGRAHKLKGDPWWGTFALPEAKMVFSKPYDIDARIDVDMKDTEPIVALFDAKKGVPKFVERLMTIENVAMDANVDVSADQVAITDLDVTGKGLKFMGDLSFGEKGRDGLLYVRFHGFSLGIQLEAGEKKDLKFIRPRAWFEKQREANRKAAAQAASP